MRAEIDCLAVAPEIVVSLDGKTVAVRAELTKDSADGPVRTGKHVQLGLTPRDAAKLLESLLQANRILRLPVSEKVAKLIGGAR
jgi:hypothetical protein